MRITEISRSDLNGWCAGSFPPRGLGRYTDVVDGWRGKVIKEVGVLGRVYRYPYILSEVGIIVVKFVAFNWFFWYLRSIPSQLDRIGGCGLALQICRLLWNCDKILQIIIIQS